MLLVTLFEQPERLVFVAESRINRCKLVKIDVSVRGQVPEFFGDLQRISPPARDGINPTKAVSNELVLRCNNFGLLRYFVVFGNGLRVRALQRVCPNYVSPNPSSVRIKVECFLVLSNRLVVSPHDQIAIR